MLSYRDRYYSKFLDALDKRLDQGHKDYGDKSFERPLAETVGEIEEELLDQAGWAFIAYVRLQETKRAMMLMDKDRQASAGAISGGGCDASNYESGDSLDRHGGDGRTSGCAAHPGQEGGAGQ